MQENTKSKLHEDLISESVSYRKLYLMGICRISDESEESVIFELGSPNYLLKDLWSAIEIIWPSAYIKYDDSKIPLEVRVSANHNFSHEEYITDRSNSQIIDFQYNPNLIKTITGASEIILATVFSNFNNILDYGRKKNVHDDRIPEKWPLDKKMEEITHSLVRVTRSLFNTGNPESFTVDTERFALLILNDTPQHRKYFSESLINSISDRYGIMKHLLI
jgi:hypothetical protein